MDDEISKKRKKKGKVREYTEALLTAALVAFVIRAFVIEAFKIPSGSMIPTLSIGDHIFVNKFTYGLRIPFTKLRYFQFHEPRRGDVIVFIYPVEEDKDFIKRVMGLPGDRIHIEGEDVEINGERLSKQPLHLERDVKNTRLLRVTNGVTRTVPFEQAWQNFHFFLEDVGGQLHLVQYEKLLERETFDVVVPPGHLFVMGDNRDNSADSREWGFVPVENVKGKAMFVWFSLDHDQGGIRWHEFGRWVR